MGFAGGKLAAVLGGVFGGALLIGVLIWFAPTWFAPAAPGPVPGATPDDEIPGGIPSEEDPEPGPEPTPDPVTGLIPVTIQLVFADWVGGEGVIEVSGYTESVVQSGGTCTLTAQGPGGPFEVTRDALEDRTVTTCGTLDIPGDKLVNGEYEVTLSYRSATHEGTSATTKVRVTK